jgi:predicted DNA-binding protein (UPF0251 family)
MNKGCRLRGRPRVQRHLDGPQDVSCFAPRCRPQSGKSIKLWPEEVEALRLINLLGLKQEQAASMLGISRWTLWRDMHAARKKLTDVFIHGKLLQVTGCTRDTRPECPWEDSRHELSE